MAYTAEFSVSVGDPTKASDVTTLAANDDYLKAAVDGKAALSGSTNNTVAMVTGANALIGEADLTFASNKLTVFGTTGAGTATAGVLNLSTRETTVVDADQLGRIDFQAPAETGSDALLVTASIYAEADVTFDATSNATDLVLATAHDGAAAERFRITSQGEIGLAGANYGSDGPVLTSAGAGAAAAWEAIPPGTTLSGSTPHTVATVTGANALEGEANLTFTGSALTCIGTVTVGVDNTGHDVKFHGDASGTYMGWDESDERLNVSGGVNQKAAEFWSTGPGPHIVVSGEAEAQNDNPAKAFNATKAQVIGSSHSAASVSAVVTNSGGTLTGDLKFMTNSGDNLSKRMRIISGGSFGAGIGIGTAICTLRDLYNSADADQQLSIDTATPAANINLTAYTSGASLQFGLKNAAGNKVRVAGCSSSSLVTTTGAETASLILFTKPAGSGVQARLTIDSAGDFTGSSSADISDSRLKENVVSLTECLAQVNALRGVSYNFIPEAHKNDDLRYGLVAQEVEGVIPAIVWDKSIHDKAGVEAVEEVLYVEGDEIPEGKNIGDVKTPAIEGVDAEVYKSLHYTGLIPVFIEAIKKLTARLEALESA